MTDEEYEMRKRIAATYREALDTSHGNATVTIHVGQDAWDYLQSLATRDMFGFSLFLEMAWSPDAIQVRTTKVIA